MALEDLLSRSKTLIFDTGPLWEFILFQAIHEAGYQLLAPQLSQMKTQPEFHRLSSFVDGFVTRTTTPYVVAQLSHFIKTSEKRGRPGTIWKIAHDQFDRMHIDERLIKLLDMPIETVIRLGAADTSVLELGLSMLPDQPTILTSERALFGKCQSEGLRNTVQLATVIAS